MKKTIIGLITTISLGLMSCGGAYSSNAIYEKVNAGCPGICYKDNLIWTGKVKINPVTISCICEEKNK